MSWGPKGWEPHQYVTSVARIHSRNVAVEHTYGKTLYSIPNQTGTVGSQGTYQNDPKGSQGPVEPGRLTLGKQMFM